MHRHIPDEIYLPAPPASTADTAHYHIIFLPGNPGCVAYYETYLAHLYSLLNTISPSSALPHSTSSTQPPHAKEAPPRYTIYARSYPGFTLNQSTTTSALSKRVLADSSGSWSLQKTIEFAEAVVQSYVAKLASRSSSSHSAPASAPKRSATTTSSTTTSKPKIILIAHSLGTYITLELLRRRNARLVSLRKGEYSSDAQYSITSCVLLFPTVMDLALSSNGVKFGWALKSSYTAPLLSVLALALVSLLTGFGMFGDAALVALVKLITGMTDDAAGVTAKWLGTEKGVFQAIKLAADEMREITHDRWQEDVWGVASSPPRGISTNAGRQQEEDSTQLLFYYGETDHWVANETRDALIAARGGSVRKTDDAASSKKRKGDVDVDVVEVGLDAGDGGAKQVGEEAWRPRMIIGEAGIPHGFCIRHSEPVAKMTAAYLREVLR